MTDADVIIKSDHLPLKKFLNKQTMNSKVNNWAVELEQFRLHLKWILGSHNLLADSLSHLLDVLPDVKQQDELADHEFGSFCFEELEPAKVLEIISTEVIEPQMTNSKDLEDMLKLWERTRLQSVLPNGVNKLPENGCHKLVSANPAKFRAICGYHLIQEHLSSIMMKNH